MGAEIDRLIQQLEHTDRKERIDAVDALVQIGSRAVPDLLSALHHKQWYVRMNAARALGEIGDPQAIEELLLLLGDPTDPTVVAAVKALGKLGDERVLTELRDLYTHAISDKRYSVAAAIEDSFVQNQASSRQLLVEMLAEGKNIRKVSSVLARMGDDGQNVLREHLNALESRARVEILRGICDSRSLKSFQLMRDLLATEEQDAALASIAYYFQVIPSQEAEPVLIGALAHPYPPTRQVCAKALSARIGGDAIPSIQGILEDPDLSARMEAIKLLGELGDLSLFPTLSGLVEHSDWEMRRAAVQALGDLGDVKAIDSLVTRLHSDEQWMVRKEAARALGNYREPGLIPELTKALHDPDPGVRESAAISLQRFGKEAAAALPVLIRIAQNQSDHACKAALQALSTIGGEDTIPVLVKMLRRSEIGMRDHAARSLERLIISGAKVRDTAPLIEILLKSEWDDARWRAAYLLGLTADRRAVSGLIQALGDASANVRITAIDALGSIRDRRCVEMLIPMLKDNETAIWGEGAKSKPIYMHAYEALAQIGGEKAAAAIAEWKNPSDSSSK